jgi:hypothetical protein
VLFGGLVYNFYRSTKIATQTNFGWYGQGNYHQIEPALFIGWVELFKTENIDESTTFEIEKTLSACKP